MSNAFSDLLERSVKPARLVVGLMSGTSADSIDVAICRIEGQAAEIRVQLIHYREHAHDPTIKFQILKAAELGVRAIAELNVLLGEVFARACLLSLEEASVLPAEVDLIGSHGQTIYHHSGVTGGAEQRFNSETVISSQYRQGVMSSPIFVLATLPPAEKAHHSHRLLIPSSLLAERLRSLAEGQSLILVGLPISRCSILTQLMFSDSTPVPRMRHLIA